MAPLDLYAPEFAASRVQSLPKTDVHVHAESTGRLLRVIERRRGWELYRQRPLIEEQMHSGETGLRRLVDLNRALTQRCNELAKVTLSELCEQPDYAEALLEALMEEEASEGSMLAEVRMGYGWPLYAHFPDCFRAAERRVQVRHPSFCAEPIIAWSLNREASLVETVARYTLMLAGRGVAGIDLYPEYHYWDSGTLFALAERAANAGLGVTCHAGEFELEVLWDVLDMPGLTRLGHATQAYRDPALLDELAKRGIAVEVALTSNVVTGAVPALEEHPIRRFVAAGVKVTLCSDDPVMFDTTIGREYAIAAALGFSDAELQQFARNGIEASFTSDERKAALLKALDAGSPMPEGDVRTASSP